MGRFKDLAGEVYGNFTVLSYEGKKIQVSGKNKSLWRVRCVCGIEKVYTSDSITANKIKSCGCIPPKSKVTHNLSKTKIYKLYKQMVSRCHNPKDPGYSTYGAVGVNVCSRWREPNHRGLLNFIQDMGQRPKGTTLNRIRGAEVYSKETCEWATLSIQAYDQKKSKYNTSGRTGVCKHSETKWTVEICCGKRIYIGCYKTFEEAVKAREAAELKYFGWIKE